MSSRFGDILAFSRLAALLMRRCGFIAGQTSSSCFMVFLGSSCHQFSASAYALICSPFVTSPVFCLWPTILFAGDVKFV